MRIPKFVSLILAVAIALSVVTAATSSHNVTGEGAFMSHAFSDVPNAALSALPSEQRAGYLKVNYPKLEARFDSELRQIRKLNEGERVISVKLWFGALHDVPSEISTGPAKANAQYDLIAVASRVGKDGETLPPVVVRVVCLNGLFDDAAKITQDMQMVGEFRPAAKVVRNAGP